MAEMQRKPVKKNGKKNAMTSTITVTKNGKKETYYFGPSLAMAMFG